MLCRSIIDNPQHLESSFRNRQQGMNQIRIVLIVFCPCRMLQRGCDPLWLDLPPLDSFLGMAGQLEFHALDSTPFTLLVAQSHLVKP